MFVYRAEKLKEENYMTDMSNKYEFIYKMSMKELSKSIDKVKLFNRKVRKDVERTFVECDNEDSIDCRIEMYKKIYIENRKEYVSKMVDIANKYYNYRFIALDRNYISKENIDLIYKQIKECKEQNKELRVGIDGSMMHRNNNDGVDYIYSDEELDLLVDLNGELISNGYKELVFHELEYLKDKQDFDEAWSFSKVIEANSAINRHAKYILDRNFTPFEAMIYIHKAASEMLYTNHDRSNFEIGRTLPSVIVDKQIVCSGYASFVKAIVDKVNLKGLSCNLQGCGFLKPNGIMESGHCHNLIHIEDPSYGIKGVYLNDACLDAKVNTSDYSSVGLCLYPIEDITCFKSDYYEVDEKDRLSHLIIDLKNAKHHKWALDDNVLKRSIGTVITTVKKYKVPSFVKTYYQESEPILVGKYQEALREILKEEYSGSDLNEEVDGIILNSIERVLFTFGEESCSDFVKQYKQLKAKIIIER